MSRAHALLLLPVLGLVACTSAGGASPSAEGTTSQEPAPASAQLVRPTGVSVLPEDGGEDLAAATSRALFAQAPVVVVAPAGDRAAQAGAASFAVATGAPVLLSPPPSAGGAATAGGTAAQEELARLEPEAVVAFGEPALTWAADATDVDVVAAPADAQGVGALSQGRTGAARAVPPADLLAAVADLPLEGPPLLQPAGAPPVPVPADQDEPGELPELGPAQRQDGLVVLASPDAPDAVAAVATARAAGADVHLLGVPDPRADGEVVSALSSAAPSAVVALGSGFGDAAVLQEQVETARTGALLPGGGQLVLPGKLYVALYGHPGSDALGVLGEQGVEATVARAKELAASYEAAGSTVPVVPTFEIITTVASSALGDGDYSAESTLDHVRPLVEAAGREGVYVVLDLQPGYDDFLTQAKMYEELLALPHVGLALDPEWRLEPGQRHMQQIGSVSAAEVNSVVHWLAELVRERDLPQKMLLLHQFKTYMLEDREQIEVTRPELSVVVQMDGHGAPGTKLETWNVLRPGSHPQLRWGWKNFYDEDTPTLTPAQTLAVEPTPVFVSYQ
jgi:hypothetical protein